MRQRLLDIKESEKEKAREKGSGINFRISPRLHKEFGKLCQLESRNYQDEINFLMQRRLKEIAAEHQG